MVFELVQPAKHWMFEAEESFAAGVVLVQEGRTAGQTEKDGRRSGHPRNTRPVELPADETILQSGVRLSTKPKVAEVSCSVVVNESPASRLLEARARAIHQYKRLTGFCSRPTYLSGTDDGCNNHEESTQGCDRIWHTRNAYDSDGRGIRRHIISGYDT